MNEEAPLVNLPEIPQTKIDGIMGDNVARMMGWIDG